jgi:hypothetical protein
VFCTLTNTLTRGIILSESRMTKRYTSPATLLQDRLEQIGDTEYPESKILELFQDVWQLDNGKQKFFIINTNTERSTVM